MASIAESGLFPPIINAYMPAYNILEVKNDGLTIDFNVSPYNDLTDIKQIQVSIIRQSNYKSALSDSYALGIYVYDLPADLTTIDTFITIPFADLNLSELSYNEYYKVQTRLSKVTFGERPLTELSQWLNDEANLAQFSEWSTVSLIRFIAPPEFSLDGNGETFNTSSNVITSSMLTLSGIYSKQKEVDINNQELRYGKNDLEYLSSYKIQVLLNDDVLFDSKEQEVSISNLNSINYTIPFYFEPTSVEEDLMYYIKLYYTTANLYQNEITYPLQVNYTSESWGSQGNPVTEVISLDSVIGKVNVNISSKTNGANIPEGSKVMIRRSSDLDNFLIWDTVYIKNVGAGVKIIDFNDFTIESGTIYKYEINYISNDSTPVTYTIVEGPVLSVFDHAFLTGEGVQLCVKFDPDVSGFKYNVSDNIVNTIGGQYPYVTRNGAMKYRSFTLSGTIAYEMDVEHQFTSRTALYGDLINVYGSYFVNHYFNQQNDRVTQRKFRQMVQDYFYDDIPKLFRSTPEGNILVRLTGASFSPKNELGRMIYSFSCTATEIGDCSIDNYKLYKIQDFGDDE